MGRKSDEIADADYGETSGEHATVGIIKKRREATACGEGAAELGLCTPRGKGGPIEPERQKNGGPQRGRSRMDEEGNQDTLK